MKVCHEFAKCVMMVCREMFEFCSKIDISSAFLLNVVECVMKVCHDVSCKCVMKVCHERWKCVMKVCHDS